MIANGNGILLIIGFVFLGIKAQKQSKRFNRNDLEKTIEEIERENKLEFEIEKEKSKRRPNGMGR